MKPIPSGVGLLAAPGTQPVSEVLLEVLRARRFADLVTVVSSEIAIVPVGGKLLVERSGAVAGSLGRADLDTQVVEQARRVMTERKSQVLPYEVDGLRVEAFHEVLEPQPQMLILGAGHIAVPLAQFARMVGFEVVVLDDRDKYANDERFPDASEVIAADFGETLKEFPLSPFTYVVIVTRGHTFDEEALRVLLEREVAYIGMIGSRRRVETVLRTLGNEGYDRERLREIYAPIGLDIGSEMPEEIALAIIAEVVLVRRGGTGQPLSRTLRPMAF
jgi:xanthine dehydrogenase accessory factor